MADYFDPNKTALDNINDLKKRLEKGTIDFQNYIGETKKIYATIFALRAAVNSTAGKSKTLEYRADPAAFKQYYDQIMKSGSFQRFIDSKGNDAVKALFAKGHGGEAEKSFKEFVTQETRLAKDLPPRFMPTANARIEQFQHDLEPLDATSEGAIRMYSEIFRARRAVGASHGGDKKKLELPVNGQIYAKTADFEKSATFKQFVEEKGPELKTLIMKGHGGAAEHLYRDYVAELDHIPADVPASYMTTAKTRTEKLKEKIKSPAFETYSKEKKRALYIEMMAARSCVGAKRKTPDTLDRYMDPKNLNAWITYWNSSKTLKEFMEKEPAAVKDAATSGHGGALKEKFAEHVKGMERIPADVPDECMPSAFDRIETLQDKIKKTTDPVRREKLYTELMATRMAVDSVRKDKESLKKPLSAAKLNQERDKLTKSAAFKNFLLSKDAQTFFNAAKSGHGGELDDMFRGYAALRSLQLGCTPAGVPERFRPSPDEVGTLMRRELSSKGRVMPENWFTENGTLIKKQVASILYIQKVNASGQSEAGKKAMMSHDKMQDGVRSIMNDPKFVNMCAINGLKTVAQKAGKDSPTELIEAYNRAPGQLRPRPQPQQNINNPQNNNQQPNNDDPQQNNNRQPNLGPQPQN